MLRVLDLLKCGYAFQYHPSHVLYQIKYRQSRFQNLCRRVSGGRDALTVLERGS